MKQQFCLSAFNKKAAEQLSVVPSVCTACVWEQPMYEMVLCLHCECHCEGRQHGGQLITEEFTRPLVITFNGNEL